jgi:hypothetical protein
MDYSKLGAIQRPKDERDILLGTVQAPVSIPTTYLPDDSWLVRNFQGQTPTCGAHASSHFKAVLDHLQNPSLAPHYTPRFSWIRIKAIDGIPLGNGTDMRFIFKSEQNDGMDDFEPLENDVTLPLPAYSEVSAVTPDMTANAKPKAIQSYAFGNTDFESICQTIYQNGAALLLVKCDDGFWGTSAPTFTTPEYGHFVCADGYDENNIRVIDSADPNPQFAVKMIAKQYVTPQFFFESGTAVDIPPSVQAVATHPTLTPEQKASIIQTILNDIEQAVGLVKQELGSL